VIVVFGASFSVLGGGGGGGSGGSGGSGSELVLAKGGGDHDGELDLLRTSTSSHLRLLLFWAL
jgi:hypothetical protein